MLTHKGTSSVIRDDVRRLLTLILPSTDTGSGFKTGTEVVDESSEKERADKLPTPIWTAIGPGLLVNRRCLRLPSGGCASGGRSSPFAVIVDIRLPAPLRQPIVRKTYSPYGK